MNYLFYKITLHYKVNNKKYNSDGNSRKNETNYFSDSLEPLEKREFRNEFIRVSGIQFSTFYTKLQRNSFSKLEKEAIQKLIGEQNEITF